MSKKSDLPFGSEFSPSQIELPVVLELADNHAGDWRAFEEAVRSAYFEEHKTNDYNRGKLANNTKLGMIAYGIINRDASLTPFGQELLALKDGDPALYERLAKHILLKSPRHDARALHSGHGGSGREGKSDHTARRPRRARCSLPIGRKASKHDASLA